MGGNHHRLEVVDLLELERLGVRRAGHPGKLAVHAEIVLERDRRERLVLALDRHAFLRLDRLVQAVGPAAPGHQTAGELVDDDDFAVLHDVLLVAKEQGMRAKRCIQVMHQADVVRVVEARAGRNEPRLRQDRFGVLVTFFRQEYLMRLFVDPVVAGALLIRLPSEAGGELVQAVIQLDVVVGLTGDDERRARLVDQDRVDFIDDRVLKCALHAFARCEHHVVAQVIEAELVVRAVRDVGGVRRLLFGVRQLRQVDTDGQAEKTINPPHPIGVALGQIVVDGDDVHGVAPERVEIGG